MADLPEFVYLVTTPNEWPVTAIADCHSSTPRQVAEAVKKRRESTNVGRDGIVQVWRCRLADVTEMEVVPERTVPATLTPKGTGADG